MLLLFERLLGWVGCLMALAVGMAGSTGVEGLMAGLLYLEMNTF